MAQSFTSFYSSDYPGSAAVLCDGHRHNSRPSSASRQYTRWGEWRRAPAEAANNKITNIMNSEQRAATATAANTTNLKQRQN